MGTDSEYDDNIDGLAWVTFDKASGKSGSATPRIFVGVADVGESVFKSEDGGATCEYNQLFIILGTHISRGLGYWRTTIRVPSS